jgi:hypothetical protein
MNELITIVTLFSIISILFALEASTSLARIAGLNTGSLASGLQLQSGLSLFSRALMAIFMPMLGGFADSGYFNNENIKIVYCSTLLIPLFLYATYFLKSKILGFYHGSAINLVEKGSYFPIKSNRIEYKWPKNNKDKLNRLRVFGRVTFLAYIPYYLTWPIIIMFLSHFPDSRGFIIGLSSIMNGVTTLALVLYVDPLLIKLSKYKNLSILIYKQQLKIRILSAILSCMPFVIGGLYLLFFG